jgi:hypothetical protein
MLEWPFLFYVFIMHGYQVNCKVTLFSNYAVVSFQQTST